jgi:hypothetical protein
MRCDESIIKIDRELSEVVTIPASDQSKLTRDLYDV